MSSAGLRGGAVRPGDRVVVDDVEHTVLGFSGTSVRLLGDDGEQQVLLLAQLQSAPGFRVVAADPPVGLAGLSVLADVPEQAAARARWWERHIIEVGTVRCSASTWPVTPAVTSPAAAPESPTTRCGRCRSSRTCSTSGRSRGLAVAPA